MATNKTEEKRWSDFISCRTVLNIMMPLGFMVNYMLRVNLTIAIVEMVKSDTNSTGNGTFDGNSTSYEESDVVEGYDWNAHEQNLILGSFYWGYIMTELPGGRLAEMIGARRVFGYSMIISSLVTLLTPIAANMGYVAVIILRIIVGFMLGATFPATQPLASKWIPPMDRTKFVSHMMASSLGAAVTLPVCGYLIAGLGWQSVFYVTGVVGIIWSLAWFYLCHDSPAQHPRISREEREELEKALGTSSTSKKVHRVPWKQLLTSMPVWAIVITHGVNVFCYFTIVNQLPTYMKYILHFNIKENGLFSSLPYLGKYVMALSTGILADWLRRSGKMSTTFTRKIFTIFAIGIPAFLLVLQVYKGHDATWSIAIFTVALTVNGAVTAGHLGNGLDIAPNFSGTIFGMANTLSSLGGYVSTYMVGVLTHENQTYGQWQIVFWILAASYFVSCTMFLIFGTGELQSWNSTKPVETNGHIKEDGHQAPEAIPLKDAPA